MIAWQTGWARGWVASEHGVCSCPEPLRSREPPMRSTVLTADDGRRVMPMRAAVDRRESALQEHAEGTMGAPPRFRVDVDQGAVIFTAGAAGPQGRGAGRRGGG